MPAAWRCGSWRRPPAALRTRIRWGSRQRPARPARSRRKRSNRRPGRAMPAPQNVHSAYDLPQRPACRARRSRSSTPSTIPTAEADLGSSTKQFGLPACTAANGCFRSTRKAAETARLPRRPTRRSRLGGRRRRPTSRSRTAVCQSCKILLVEADSNDNDDLEAAEEKAAQLGATEISNSWGGPEEGRNEPKKTAQPSTIRAP